MNDATSRPLRKHQGTVLEIDPAAGTVTALVDYRDGEAYLPPSRREPLTIPTPAAMPDWCRQRGAEFSYFAPQNPRRQEYADPAFMTRFEEPPLWWLTIDELERLCGWNGHLMTNEEYDAIVARKPAVYRVPGDMR